MDESPGNVVANWQDCSRLRCKVRTRQFLQQAFCGEAAVGFSEWLRRFAFGCRRSGGMSGAFVFDFNPASITRILFHRCGERCLLKFKMSRRRWVSCIGRIQFSVQLEQTESFACVVPPRRRSKPSKNEICPQRFRYHTATVPVLQAKVRNVFTRAVRTHNFTTISAMVAGTTAQPGIHDVSGGETVLYWFAGQWQTGSF